MAIAKVIVNGSTRLDLTSDTVAWNNLLSTYTAHDKTGGSVMGTIPQLSAQDVTNTGSYMYIPAGYFSQPVAESAATLSASTITPGTTNQVIASGQYITGPQTILGDANLVGSNIISGVSIFGVNGTASGGGGGGEYYDVYKAIALNAMSIDTSQRYIDATMEGMSDFCNSLVHDYGTFMGRKIGGDFIFENLIDCIEGAFASTTGAYGDTRFFTLSLPVLTYMPRFFAYYRPRLTSVYAPNVSWIGDSVFTSCSQLSSIYAPNIGSVGIGNDAFAYTSLVTSDFPLCGTVGGRAFILCKSLTTVSMPQCSYIGYSAFYGCSSLQSVFLPACTSISNAAFQGCIGLTNISLPNCHSIGDSAFYGCTGLTDISLSHCYNVGPYAFYNCKSLISINCESIASIPSNLFYGCSALKEVKFGTASFIGSYAFLNCQALSSAYFGNVRSISNSAFYNCKNLFSLYLMGSVMATLGSRLALYGTPISTSVDGVFGSIFVPASLLASYQVATNWSSYSSRFVAFTSD